jgi:hypothetical protein
MAYTKKSNLKYIEQHQIAKEIIINENMEKLDNDLLLAVIDIIAAPTEATTVGLYIIAETVAYSVWTGYQHCFVRFFNGTFNKPWPIPAQTVFLIIRHGKWYIKTENALQLYQIHN